MQIIQGVFQISIFTWWTTNWTAGIGQSVRNIEPLILVLIII